MFSKSLALVLLLAGTSLAWAGQQYQSYFNDRFGVSADVPRGWTSGAEPDNSDGLRWTSPDGTAEVAVYGGFQVLDSLEEAFGSQADLGTGAVTTYKAKGKHGLTVSGLKDDKIIYRRSLLSCKDTVWNTVEITYPKAQKAAFDPIVAHIAASLKPGTGFSNADCK